MLGLRRSRQAARFITGRPPKHSRQIAARIQALRDDPSPSDSKALRGSSEGFRRADTGEYRIIYRVDDECLGVAVTSN